MSYQVIEKTGEYLDEAGMVVAKYEDPQLARADADRRNKSTVRGETRWYEVHPER